jgi:hypothetical protein
LRAEMPGKEDYYVRCVQHQRAEDQLNSPERDIVRRGT